MVTGFVALLLRKCHGNQFTGVALNRFLRMLQFLVPWNICWSLSWSSEFSRHILVLILDTGVVAFVEEDHYVAPDFLWVLDLMETSMIQNLCHGCNLLALGTYLKTWNIKVANSRVSPFKNFLNPGGWIVKNVIRTAVPRTSFSGGRT